jgi:hypothetical protein
MTGVIYYVTGQVAVVSLRRISTLVIMSLPALVGLGFWIGTERVRGWEAGMKAKGVYTQPPVIYQDQSGQQQLPQLTQSSVVHQEPVDVTA